MGLALNSRPLHRRVNVEFAWIGRHNALKIAARLHKRPCRRVGCSRKPAQSGVYSPHMRAGFDSRQQRLRFRDLRHFGRRHETFEGRREDGVDVDRTAGRLIELGERERHSASSGCERLAVSRRRRRSGRLLPRQRVCRDRPSAEFRPAGIGGRRGHIDIRPGPRVASASSIRASPHSAPSVSASSSASNPV